MTLAPPKTKKKITSSSAICIFPKNCLQSFLHGFVTAGVVKSVSIVAVVCVSDEFFTVVVSGDVVDIVDPVTTYKRTETIGESLLTPYKSHFILYTTAQKSLNVICVSQSNVPNVLCLYCSY